jgi:Putative transposase
LPADINRFILHAGVRWAANDRQALEKLCLYIAHPALANERV